MQFRRNVRKAQKANGLRMRQIPRPMEPGRASEIHNFHGTQRKRQKKENAQKVRDDLG